MPESLSRQDRVNEAIGYALIEYGIVEKVTDECPDIYTLHAHACAAVEGATLAEVSNAIRWARERFAEGSGEFNVVCVPLSGVPATSRFRYALVSSQEAAEPWVRIRVNDATARITTLVNVLGPVVRATDGRSLDGRRARLIETGVRHIQENLENLVADAGLNGAGPDEA